MGNAWIFGGVVVVAVSAGAAAINMGSNTASASTHALNTPALSARQQMARMIAETAARTAAQTTKALVSGRPDDHESGALVQATAETESNRR